MRSVNKILVTQKQQYALRAIFELAKQKKDTPIKTAEIAKAQAIPIPFLERIMHQLGRCGLVKSKRGAYGGFTLQHPPEEITVGHIFRVLNGNHRIAPPLLCIEESQCPLNGNCAFKPLWDKVQQSIYHVYDSTTIQDLLNG